MPLPELFTFTPKPSRQLSLQTYLAAFPEWSSSTRIVSLYSEFEKLKETNPFGYEANITWWQTVILGAARNGLLSAYQPYSESTLYTSSSYTHDSRPTDSGSGAPGAKPRYEPTGATIGILELELDHLATKFQKNGRRPHSLAAVLSEMTRMGIVIPRSEFLPWAGVGWTGWIFHKVVKAPLLWSLKQLSLSDSSTTPPGYSSSLTLASTGLSSPGVGSGSNGNLGIGGIGASSGGTSTGLGLGLTPSSSPSTGYRDTFVVLSFVQEAATRILKLQQESTSYHASDNLMTFADFRQKFSRTALQPIRRKSVVLSEGALGGAGPVIVLTDRDLEILIRYMQYELKVLVTGKIDESKQTNEVQDHELVVKFANKDTIRDKAKQEITTADRGIIELRETCNRLDKQVQDIEERISELTEKARACVKKKQRSQATYALRQRKHLEDVLNKRLKSIDTISSILFRIQSSETDAEVLQSYKLGTSTLASVMATKDEDGQELLRRDKVEATMDRLADVFADQQEVDQAMSDGADLLLENTLSGGVDEDALMAELDALEDQPETKPTPSTVKTMAPPKKYTSPEKPLAIKKTTPPLPSDPFVTSLYGSTPATPGKRVAEIPEQTFVKQRKVSQATIHSPRLNSEGLEANEVLNNSRSTRDVSEQAEPMVTDSSPETLVSSSTRMETDQEASERTQQTDEKEQHQEMDCKEEQQEGLSSQEARDLDALLTTLQDIHAPEGDTLMNNAIPRHRSVDVIESEDEDKKGSIKARRMMEYK
ncbi:hypothetical protein BGX23_012601 [Mortierella sp. AD031]|nr:hypothetical protein BGX23_012601 [Mortierella sp. AD031]